MLSAYTETSEHGAATMQRLEKRFLSPKNSPVSLEQGKKRRETTKKRVNQQRGVRREGRERRGAQGDREILLW